ncbi:hypothetical protein Ahy_B10g104380 [Arachis hypogaea]|uniref:Transposase MuDR plant domain-containing protein n=1 Tax=Arachis hypogaea TaxID=3818 RepID=A0A444X5E2_ARAHY|nr:hypothetical protein Ahy_B10g104380 [Arachis hypogaea]
MDLLLFGYGNSNCADEIFTCASLVSLALGGGRVPSLPVLCHPNSCKIWTGRRCRGAGTIRRAGMLKGTANIVVFHNGEVVRNTYEGVSFAFENMFLFVVLCTIMFAELQYGLCQSIEADIVKRVTNILYRSLVVVFGDLIQFEVMPIIDEISIQRIFCIHQETHVQHPRIELYVEFEHIIVDVVQDDPDVQDDRVEACLGMYDDSDEEFEATYETGDKDEDGNGGSEAVLETLVVPAAVSQLMDVPPFIRSLDLDAMYAPEFSKYANIGVADLEDGEFRIGMEYGSRKSVIETIQSYVISRGVDYVVYESEPQTFYAKCKTYGRGCDWLIQASLIQKKACWKIRRYNGRHTCSMGTISQDHPKKDHKC